MGPISARIIPENAVTVGGLVIMLFIVLRTVTGTVTNVPMPLPPEWRAET